MVEHLICNEEMAVRFCLGPPVLPISLAHYLNYQNRVMALPFLGKKYYNYQVFKRPRT